MSTPCWRLLSLYGPKLWLERPSRLPNVPIREPMLWTWRVIFFRMAFPRRKAYFTFKVLKIKLTNPNVVVSSILRTRSKARMGHMKISFCSIASIVMVCVFVPWGFVLLVEGVITSRRRLRSGMYWMWKSFHWQCAKSPSLDPEEEQMAQKSNAA